MLILKLFFKQYFKFSFPSVFHQNCQKRRQLCWLTFNFIFVVDKYYQESALKIGGCWVKNKLVFRIYKLKLWALQSQGVHWNLSSYWSITATHTNVHGSRNATRECRHLYFPLIYRYHVFKFFLSQPMPYWELVWIVNFMNAKILPILFSNVFSVSSMPHMKQVFSI